MGNCQAIDAATLVIQHPCGKVENLYWPVSASYIMKTHPGHYVALLLTTTTTTSSRSGHPSSCNNSNNNDNKKCGDRRTVTASRGGSCGGGNMVRVTRVKLLRPTDTLALGHVYRLITTQEVMKGMVAKKQAKMNKSGLESVQQLKESDKLAARSLLDETNQVGRQERHRSRTTGTANAGTAKPKIWQPSLHSISEAGS